MESRLIKILAIDDNPDNLITIQALVNEVYPDFIILKALNGMHGLKLAEEENPDVILLDIVMPGMDGFEVCQRLKADKNLATIPVVFVTAIKGDKASRIKALECGAEAFLAKPIDESELIAQIRAMVKIRTAYLERYNENERLSALIAERTYELKKTHTATLNLLEDLKNENEARKKTEEALRRSEEKFRGMAELLPQIIFETDEKGNLTYINQQAYKCYRADDNDCINGRNILDFFISEDKNRASESFKMRMANKYVSTGEYTLTRKDGTFFPVLVYSNPIIKDDISVGLRGIVVNITEQKQAEEKISHIARLYALLSQIDQAIVRTQNKNELYQMICQVATEFGHFKMAWIGIFEESTKIINPVVWAGHVDGYLDDAIIMGDLQPTGLGPTGSAFREEKIIYCNDIATDPKMLPWRDEALKRGYKSSIAVPFQRKGVVIGTFTLYATEVDFFGDDELRLLKEIGDDITFAINAIDTENQRNQTEKALEQSRNELKTIYDHAPVMMCVVDKNRHVLFANPAFSALTGIEEEDITGRGVGNVIGCFNSLSDKRGCGYGSNCIDCHLCLAIEETFKTGIGIQNIEYQATLEIAGQNKEMSLLGSTAIIHNDEKENLLLCLHDITDRKLAEEALQKSEMLLRTFIDNSPFEIWARDMENVGILENKKEVDHYGSIIGKTPLEIGNVKKEVSDFWNKNIERVQNGELVDEEFENVFQNAKHIYQQIVFPINSNEKIIGIAGFNIDITERKQAEEALRQNNSRLELAMEVANMAWWEIDINTGGVIFGKSETDILGYLPNDFVQYKDYIDLVHPEDYDGATNAMKKHLEGLEIKYETEYRILSSSGAYKWFYDLGNISKRDANGNPLTISGLVLDITDRKRAEKELYDQKQFFEQLFMQSSLSTEILDKDGWCERINPKLSQIFGVDAQSMEGKVYNIFNDKKIKNRTVLPKLENVFNNGKTAEWEILSYKKKASGSPDINQKGKNRVWYNNWAYPIFDQNGEISHVIIQHNDITDRKMAEEALSESQEQLKKFAAHLQNIREEERVLLSREIHDELGQILIAIKIDMGMLKQSILKTIDPIHSNEVLIKFDSLFNLVDNTIKTARKIMTDLRPEVLDLLGFIETIKQHLIIFQERYKIRCIFENSISDIKLDSQQSVALFRIIQEALNNVAKHSKATELKVRLNQREDKLSLEVVDNGIGFDESHKKNLDSYGLIGMKERVFLLDGELTIVGKKGVGTSIKVVMPYSIRNEE
jgi:PAS domain S-box-containing protein